MAEEKIHSDESEGLFNDFIQDRLEDLVEDLISGGDMDRLGDGGSDIVVETDDILPPTFVYDDAQGGAGGGRGPRPGTDKEKLRFNVSFQRLMELIAERLQLPRLTKEGQGRIKHVSYSFKTFGPVGAVLDKRRTFKRALRSSVGLGVYDPARGAYDIQVRRRDRRYKVPLREEKPRYRAVVLYLGDISYSTHGERLELEKRLVNFIHHWLDFNYGPGNVEHRFLVHDAEAYEVSADEFYQVSTAGGTRAAIAFELAAQIAFNEYDVPATNFYAFYFGDGELFEDDAENIVTALRDQLHPVFSRVGIVEIKPSRFSYLNREVEKAFPADPVVRLADIRTRKEMVQVIQKLFRDGDA